MQYKDDIARAIAAIEDRENGKETEDTKKLQTHKILFPNERSYREFLNNLAPSDNNELSPTFKALMTMMDDPEVTSINIKTGVAKKASRESQSSPLQPKSAIVPSKSSSSGQSIESEETANHDVKQGSKSTTIKDWYKNQSERTKGDQDKDSI